MKKAPGSLEPGAWAVSGRSICPSTAGMHQHHVDAGCAALGQHRVGGVVDEDELPVAFHACGDRVARTGIDAAWLDRQAEANRRLRVLQGDAPL